MRRDVAAGWRAALAAEDREGEEGDEAAPAPVSAPAPAPAAAPYRVPDHLRMHSDRGAEGDGAVPPLSAQQVREGGGGARAVSVQRAGGGSGGGESRECVAGLRERTSERARRAENACGAREHLLPSSLRFRVRRARSLSHLPR